MQALIDDKTPLQLVQMPCVTVELTKIKRERNQSQNSQHSTRSRLDSEVHFKQSFSSRSPLFSCW